MNAGRLMKEGRANAVKLEGGAAVVEQIKAITAAGIPVMGHLGLTPQSINAFGGNKVQGKSEEAAKKLIEDALAVQEAGAFAVVLECIPAKLASIITKKLTIPTIGIGAGAGCDGQILVYQDMLGMFSDYVPKFVKRFANAVAVMVVNIGAIACRGFANATTIIISQELGKNHIDTAREYGKRMLRITIIVSLIGCAVILAIRPLILDFYRDKLTETAIYYLGVFIIMTTWRLVGEGINTCLICGCFRGGGDSRFGMIVDSIFMWLVAVPLTFLAAYVFKLPPIWVYFVMSLDELEKMPVVFIHYFRRKWLTNITRDFD